MAACLNGPDLVFIRICSNELKGPGDKDEARIPGCIFEVRGGGEGGKRGGEKEEMEGVDKGKGRRDE